MFLSKRMEHTRPPSRTVYWDSLFNKNFSKYFLKTYATVDGATDSLLSHSASSCSLLTEQDAVPRLYIRATPCAVHLCARLTSLSLLSLCARLSLAACVSLRPLRASRRSCSAASRLSPRLFSPPSRGRSSLASRLFPSRLAPLFSLLSSAAADGPSRCCSPSPRVSASSLFSSLPSSSAYRLFSSPTPNIIKLNNGHPANQ